MREAGLEPAPISRLDPKSLALLALHPASEASASITYRERGVKGRGYRNTFRNNAPSLFPVEQAARRLRFRLPESDPVARLLRDLSQGGRDA